MTCQTKGIVSTLLGGALWGFSGVAGQYLFSHYPIGAEWLAAVRMLSGGLILLLFCLLTDRKSLFGILKHKRDLLSVVLFGVFGLAFCQISYLKGILYSNAAAATVLQYVGLILIMAVTCFQERRLPKIAEWCSVLLAVGGVYLLATHGDPTQMALTPNGLLWGLISAVALVFYTLMPIRTMRTWGAIPVSGLGLLFGGIGVSCTGVLGAEISLDLPGWGCLVTVCLVGTVLAYTMYLYGVAVLGGTKASLLGCSEPVASVLLTVLLLRTPLTLMDYAGFALIMIAVLLLNGKADR